MCLTELLAPPPPSLMVPRINFNLGCNIKGLTHFNEPKLVNTFLWHWYDLSRGCLNILATYHRFSRGDQLCCWGHIDHVDEHTKHIEPMLYLLQVHGYLYRSVFVVISNIHVIRLLDCNTTYIYYHDLIFSKAFL